MMKHELSQLAHLNREIEHLKTRIRELECTASSQPSRITGMPRANGFSDTVGKYTPEIAELRSLLESNLRKCFLELIKLSKFIESIESSQMRMIITLRYVNGLSWNEVAQRIVENDEQYPRKKHNAFLNMSQTIRRSDYQMPVLKNDENYEAKMIKY